MRTARRHLSDVWKHPAAEPAVVFLALVMGCLVIWLVLTHLPDPGPCGYFDHCVEQGQI